MGNIIVRLLHKTSYIVKNHYPYINIYQDIRNTYQGKVLRIKQKSIDIIYMNGSENTENNENIGLDIY